MPFPGAESALGGVSGEGVAKFVPLRQRRPQRGEVKRPSAANRLRNCDKKLRRGFSSKKVRKSTRLVPKWAVSV